MTSADEHSLGRQLLQTLNGYFKSRANQTERATNERRGGFGARKRRKKMRAEAARQRTPQPTPSPPSPQSCRRCQLRCGGTCLPPSAPTQSPALTTNNDSEPVPEIDYFIFSQLKKLDQLLSDGLEVQTEIVVDIDTIIEKVRELIKENNNMRNFFKNFSGRTQPRDICATQHNSVATQHNSVATQTPPMARPGKHTGHARSGARDSVVEANQTLNHHVPVAGQQDVRSANSGGRGASKLPGHNPTVMHEASEPVATVTKLQNQVLTEKLNLTEKEWFWNELPVQKAYELLHQFAEPGNYLVVQSDNYTFRIIWKAKDDNIEIRDCSWIPFLTKDDTFDDDTWASAVRSFVREHTDQDVSVEPLPGKETHRMISQKRHFSERKKMVFCAWCQQYQDTLHWCCEVKEWINFDQGNLLFIRGKTRAEASRNDGWTESGSRARTFPNRNNMLLEIYQEAEDYWNAKEEDKRIEIIKWFEENKKSAIQ